MKNKFSKLGRALILLPAPLILLFTALSAVVLSLSLRYLTPESPLAIASYLFAVYTLATISVRVPAIIAWARRLKNGNKYVRAYFSSPRTRVKLSLYSSLILNGAYALFQFFLGLKHASAWYYSLAAYYLLLSVMRFLLLGHTRSYAPGERLFAELRKYRLTGVLLLILNVALTGIITLTVVSNRQILHHEITVIAMAAYTFTSFTLAIVNIVRFKKYKSPVFSAAKALSLVAATVSMLSLESSMLTTFGEGGDPSFNRIMLATTGAAVSVTVLTLSVFMIVTASKKIKASKEITTDNG